MTWGTVLGQAYTTAAGTVRDTAVATFTSISNAATAVKSTMVATMQATGNVAGFAGRATGEVLMATARGGVMLGDSALESMPFVGQGYVVVKKMASRSKTPRKTVVEPCPNTLEGKRKRLEKRKALVDLGNSPRATPEQRAAAARLARNNEAVELARLSDDTYQQYGKPPENHPPLGWSAIPKDELGAMGIKPELLERSKAVIYRTPADWPGGQKTVLAFRGTVPSEADDLKTNFNQAIGKETVQYEAAKQLGQRVAEKFGSNTLVTGHSLGGGKAQAAGAFAGLAGIMFNAAGLNPRTVNGRLPSIDQFLQYRAPGDPLTGMQNSAAAQAGVGLAAAAAMPFGVGASAGNYVAEKLGIPFLSPDASDAAFKSATALPYAGGNLLSHGNLLPPAIGQVIEAPSLDGDGRPIARTALLEQHSVKNLINGIEREKSEDVATLQETL